MPVAAIIPLVVLADPLLEGFRRAAAWRHCRLNFTTVASFSQLDSPLNRRDRSMMEVTVCTERDGREAAFFHVFKAGGTSAKRVLQLACSGTHKLYGKVGHDAPMFNATRVRNPAFAFALVRNPLSRFVSAIGEVFRRKRYSNKTIPWDPDEVIPMARWGSTVLAWMQRTKSFGDPHFFPQHTFLVLNRDKKPSLDFIGRTEDVNSTLALAAAVLGLHDGGYPPVSVQHGRLRVALNDTTLQNIALHDEDVIGICKLYWRDYAVFRLVAPAQCCESSIPGWTAAMKGAIMPPASEKPKLRCTPMDSH